MRLIPTKGFLVCRELESDKRTASGLILPKDRDKDVTDVGVAMVMEYTPTEDKRLNIIQGSIIVYRGFLRFAGQLGDLYGEERNCNVFFLHHDDVLLEVLEPCVIGQEVQYTVKDQHVKARKNTDKG